MALSSGVVPVQMWVNRDSWYLRHPVMWPTPQGDPGWGAGGSESCTVQVGSNYYIAWKPGMKMIGAYSGNPEIDPATLTGAYNSFQWWPHGIHAYGRCAYSPTFGLVISNITGIKRGGGIGTIHICDGSAPALLKQSSDRCRWTQIGETGDAPPQNRWTGFFGYNYATSQNLVYWRGELWTLGDDLAYAQGTGMPRIGSKLFTLDQSEWFGGVTGTAIENRVQLIWRNEWWIYGGVDRSQICVCKLNDGTTVRVQLPSAVTALRTEAMGAENNFALCVDQHNKRVFGIAIDPSSNNGTEGDFTTKYRVRIWQIDPQTYSFTEVSMPTPVYMYPFGNFKNCPTPLSWYGGCRFILWDATTAYGYKTPQTVEYTAWQVSEGGVKPKEIQIPLAAMPATVTFTKRTYAVQPQIGGQSYLNQKHAQAAYRTVDGKMYVFGGDKFGGSSDGNMCRVDPENTATWEVNRPVDGYTKPMAPWPCDECGWIYRPYDDRFYWAVGYYFSTGDAWGGWANKAQRDAELGIQDPEVWKYNAANDTWAHVPITWEPNAGATTQPQFPWPVNENHAQNMCYDPGTSASDDYIYRTCFGLNQVTALRLSTGIYKSARIDREFTGLTAAPSGRLIGSITVAESACVDPATGRMWWMVGRNVFYADMRAGTYLHNGQAYWRVYWAAEGFDAALEGFYDRVYAAFAKGRAWFAVSTSSFRLRLFSVAYGEDRVTEHPTPSSEIIFLSAFGVYEKSGDERLMFLGTQSKPLATPANWHSIHWTATIA